MKTIKQWMAIAIVSICAIAQVSAKERVEPQLPITTAEVEEVKESGEIVHLFNIGAGQFLTNGNSWGTQASLGEPRLNIIIQDRTRTMSDVEVQGFGIFVSGQYSTNNGIKQNTFLFRDNSYAWVDYNNQSNGDVWSLEKVGDYYRLRSAASDPLYGSVRENYDDEWFGWDKGSSTTALSTLLSAQDEKACLDWLIVKQGDAQLFDLYIAKLKLYDALISSEEYGYNVDKYEEIYANAESTPEELTAAANALNNALSLSQYGNVCGGDYPIFLEDDPNHAWERYDNYLRRNRNMSAGETQTLTATVVVDEDATIYYEPYNQNERYDERGGWVHDNHRRTNYWTSHCFYWRSDYTERYVYMEVYVDDKLVRTIDRKTLGRDGWRFFEELKPGKHTIKWVATCPEGYNSQYIDMQYIRVYKTPLTEVTLVEPGSLGNEVLYKLNRIQDVRKLKIKGPMNSDDWTQIDNMYELFALDLSEATITEIPANQLSRNKKSSTKAYLHSVKLPNTLETIGDNAFWDSYIDDMVFPATLKNIGSTAFQGTYLTKVLLPTHMQSIGYNAFGYCMSLKEVQMPETIESLGTNVFNQCCFLKKATLPTNITAVPADMFCHCLSLESVPLHEGITSIGDRAFARCFPLDTTIPSTITSFGAGAFNETSISNLELQPNASVGDIAFRSAALKHLEIPEGVILGCSAFLGNPFNDVIIHENVSLSEDCFYGCSIKYLELPSSYYIVEEMTPMLRLCSELEVVRFNSATMVTGTYKDRFLYGLGNDITIKVPDYLVNTYKQDEYWKDYNIEGFDNSEVNYWQINEPLTLTYRDRFQGSPDVEVTRFGRLVINGDAPMSLNDFSTCQDLNWPWGYNGWNTMVISNCDNVVINGQVSHTVYTTDNIWYAVSLPFDFKVSDIRTDNDAKFAIRYYDGAHRAANGNGGNWVDFPSDTIVTAGTGFIYRTSQTVNSYFTAQNNGSKQTVVSNSEFAKQLQPNPSEDEAHKGWNLVGNPYQCYYNIHKLNTTAPITVFEHGWTEQWYHNSWQWRPTAGSYKAYSLIDDDYALLPNAAFFLQCPDEATVITFPTNGRQLTAEITDQNGVKAFMQQPELRKLVDLVLCSGDTEDRTRIVFNPEARLSYERSCDAGKFAAEDKSLPQFYSLDDNETRYAINERPADDGTVRLGVIIPRAGTYKISISRNRGAGTILLYDKQEGTVTDITDNEYSFHADTGTYNDRFELVAKSFETGIIDNSLFNTHHSPFAMPVDGGIQLRVAADIYGLDGRLVARSQGGYLPVKRGMYVVRAGKQTAKITVK